MQSILYNWFDGFGNVTVEVRSYRYSHYDVEGVMSFSANGL